MSFPLDPARTAPFMLGPQDSKSAVVIVHGFTGSPWEVRPLGEALAARGHCVHGLRLPGHGTVPEAMLWVTWRDWVGAVERAVLELSRFDEVHVVGLSMGALLGAVVASRYPERVRSLVMLAPALELQGWDVRLVRLARRRRLAGLRDVWLPKTSTDLENADERARAPILPRYPMARLFDLFAVQELAATSFPSVRCPTLVVAAEHDHVVSFRGITRVQRAIRGSQLMIVRRGFHILPRDDDRALVCAAVSEFVDSHGHHAASHARVGT